MNRWWTYQRERFPILLHGPLIAIFSFSSLSFSRLLRHDFQLPSTRVALIAFLTSFILFFQLRVLDEFKDYSEDAKYRPSRPIPRGLVHLKELGILGVCGALVQIGLAFWLNVSLVPLLVSVWFYMFLMGREFFVRGWIKAHPLAYLLSHMVIMPLMYFYISAMDWIAFEKTIPSGLIWFMLAGFFNGKVIEIGRKIRHPEEEQEGVETYSSLWGIENAVFVWLGAVLMTGFFAVISAYQIQFVAPVLSLLTFVFAFIAVLAFRFLSRPTIRGSRYVEAASGIWTVFFHLIVGIVPLLLKI